jgi:hypothetical protein
LEKRQGAGSGEGSVVGRPAGAEPDQAPTKSGSGNRFVAGIGEATPSQALSTVRRI